MCPWRSSAYPSSFTAVPLSRDRETLTSVLPITVGSVLSVLLGEVLIAVRRPINTDCRRTHYMAKRIIGSTPKADGYRMPGEFEPQDRVWMLWPERNDNWRTGPSLHRRPSAGVARAIARFEKVTMCVNRRTVSECTGPPSGGDPGGGGVLQRRMGPGLRPHLCENGQGGLRAVDWTFNAWGGLYDGLYFPWDRDDQVAQKICEMADVDSTAPRASCWRAAPSMWTARAPC